MMQRVKWLALLVMVCVLAMSVVAYAQLPQGNWPKFGRDYRNSGHSPATVIAKPVVKWASECKPWGGSSSQWYTSSYDGIKIDPEGNVYAYADYCYGMAKFSPTGTKLANDSGVPDRNELIFYNGPTLYDDGTNRLVITGPQHAGSAYTDTGQKDEHGIAIYSYDESKDYRRVHILNWNLQQVAQSPLFNMANVGSHIPHWSLLLADTTLPGWTTHMSAAVGPDGTAYVGNFQISYFDPIGPLVAMNPLDGSIKWSFTEWGMGRCLGTPAIKTVDDGGVTKNVIYVSGGTYWEYAGSYAAPSIMAVRDDGTSATLLWKKSRAAVDSDPELGEAAGFITSAPVLSEDGSTVYVAGRDNWPLRRVNTAVGRPVTGTLFAYDADTGDLKWKMFTGGSHSYSPATGPGGMLYLTGGHFRTGASTDVPPLTTPGKVIAVKDNGDSAQVMWTLELPDDVESDTTAIATVNTNPTTMYVASGNGRVFCIQDQGTYGKLLWTWQAYDLKHASSQARGYAPSNIAVADDGTVYIGIRNFVYAFDASNGGFNPASPNGISGFVKDANGNPIADAWVAASTSPRPLPDNAKRLWTKTNPDGSYQIAVKDAGTYYVAAGAVGYEGSEDQMAVLTTVPVNTDKVIVNFNLGPAKLNRCIGAAATCTNVNGGSAASAVDGDLDTRVQATTPCVLTVDLGSEKTISEAVIYWEWRAGRNYSVQYSTDGVNWNDIYSTTNGNGGFPLSWYAGNATIAGPPYSDSALVGPGGAKLGADVIKFEPAAARYWRLNITKAQLTEVGSRVTGYTTSDVSLWEFELRDATKPGPIPNTVALAKQAEIGDGVLIDTAVVTAVAGGGVPADTFYIESEDRSAGMAVVKAGLSGIWFGDKVKVVGNVQANASGEKFISAISISRIGAHTITGGISSYASPPAEPALIPVGMSNKSAQDDISQGLFIKTWGKVTKVDSDYFVITDGTATPFKVKCGSVAKPALGDMVRVRGVVSKEDEEPVLYMRNERCDWTYGDAKYQALPFTGEFKYPIEYLVLGPFTDAGADVTELLDIDFIAAAGAGTEASIQPREGAAVGNKVWKRAISVDGKLDINAVFGSGTNNSLAYVYLNVWSEADMVDVGIATGADDWVKVLANGQEVCRWDQDWYPTGRSCVIGQDPVMPLSLNKGMNSILFKVVNLSGGSGLACQFTAFDEPGAVGYGQIEPYNATALGYSLNYTEE